jgi:hypothetical protein
MKFYADVVVSPLPEHKYILIEEYIYKDVVVPVGFVTNGADIPRLFWSFYPPNRSDYFPAVIIHDYLCFIREYEKADRYFKEILKALGIGSFDVFVLWGGVRFYSKFIRPFSLGEHRGKMKNKKHFESPKL